jgi:hypothetical protein
MSWQEFLSMGLVTAIFVQLIQLMREQLEKRQVTKRIARTEAFKLSNALMIVSLKCQSVIDEFEATQSFSPEPMNEIVSFPKFNFLELAEGVSGLNHDIIARIADFEFQCITEEQYLGVGWQLWLEPHDVSDVNTQRLKYYIHEAKELAELIRETNKLPPFGRFDKLVKNA